MTTTKFDKLKAHAAVGDWQAALRIAARFPSLGEHRAQIVRAHEAYLRPGFYIQIGKDPAAIVAEGIAALRARYRLPS